MTTSSTTPTTAGRRADRFSPDECRIDDFIASIGTETDLADYPYATSVQSNVLVYDAPALRSQIVDPDTRASVGDELARALLTGPGIVVFAGAFDEDTALSESTQIYTDIIDAQHAAGQSFGDHFATPGANDRIWNALQKLALRNPETFVRYYRNDILALICEAWVGPMYQVTSAINVVNPLGAAQNPHRDYHLGFMSTDTATRFRAHQHRLSAALTLQGAVAHVDMPLESGPTMYLPYSQRYEQAMSRSTCRSSDSTSPTTTSNFRCAQAMPSSSTRRCSMPQATTPQPTSSAWPTCCRCRRRSAGRWTPSTDRRCSARSTRGSSILPRPATITVSAT